VVFVLKKGITAQHVKTGVIKFHFHSLKCIIYLLLHSAITPNITSKITPNGTPNTLAPATNQPSTSVIVNREGMERKERMKEKRKKKGDSNCDTGSAQVYVCDDEKCRKVFKSLHYYRDHILKHQNPEAYKVLKDGRRVKGGRKEVELYCGFPGCVKGRGGAQEMAYHSTSHVKTHRDPATNGQWVPPCPRVTGIVYQIDAECTYSTPSQQTSQRS
jgi:hypothetical protein